jgi:hypothetical protein
MQFTHEVDWTRSDFLVMGALLAAACATYELAAWLSSNTAYRAAFGIAVVTGFLLVWVNLAVGILGSEHNRANLMFGGVLLVASCGAVIAGFGARGMARAMDATAIAQFMLAGIAVTMGFHEEALLAAGFALPWLASAQLFRKAVQESGGAGI